MRIHHVVVLIAAVLASANAASAFTPSKVHSPTLFTASHGASTQRFLGVHYTENEESSEERGIATVVEKTKALLSSSKVSEKTLERWVRNNKSPKNALIRLKLDKAGDKLLEKPQFETWAKYMTMLNKNSEAAMISALMTRYSDDVLSQMIITAEKVAGTKELAARLQAGQRSVWMSELKSADDVFKLLKLNVNSADGNLFANPQFTVWTKYVDDLNGGEAKKANSVIVSTLTDHHGDEGLAKMIRAAKDVEETKTVATNLQQAQVDNWLVTMESPKDVKKWLGVKGATSDSAEAKLYQNYVKNYEKVFGKHE